MNKDISVIIAAHKKYKMPEDGMYIPMQVGSQGKPDICYIRDNTGDNISDKNNNFSSLEELYRSLLIYPQYNPLRLSPPIYPCISFQGNIFCNAPALLHWNYHSSITSTFL